MKILIFGISNVGKTTLGQMLAHQLGFGFYDLDDEIKSFYKTTLEDFVNTGFLDSRDKKRGRVLNNLVSQPGNHVIAVCPIYYSRNFNHLLSREDVLAIELQDAPEHVFDRLVFSDENDQIYKDDDYKNEHKKHYIRDIKADISCYKRSFKKIENKFFMNNKSPQYLMAPLMTIIKDSRPYGLIK